MKTKELTIDTEAFYKSPRSLVRCLLLTEHVSSLLYTTSIASTCIAGAMIEESHVKLPHMARGNMPETNPTYIRGNLQSI